MTITDRLIGALERLGYNLLDAHKDAIATWVTNTDTAVVERMVAIIDANFKTPVVRGPVDQFFHNAEGDIEQSLDDGVMAGFAQLEAALANAAKAEGA